MHALQKLELRPFSSYIAITTDEPECRVDPDCPPNHSCVGERCQELCGVNNPCEGDLVCDVSNGFGLTRTIGCVCPPGQIADYGNLCKPG